MNALAAQCHMSSHARAFSATLGLGAPLHARISEGLGCCAQHCEGLRAAGRVQTAVRMHVASVRQLKQRSAICQAIGALAAQP